MNHNGWLSFLEFILSCHLVSSADCAFVKFLLIYVSQVQLDYPLFQPYLLLLGWPFRSR